MREEVRQSYKNINDEILPFGFSQRKNFVSFLALATFYLTISVQIVAKALSLFIRIRWLKPNGKDFLFLAIAMREEAFA